jgi:hypothetical protein
MPSQFAITAATNTLRLDEKRQSEAQFTVFNASGRPLRGRVRIVSENPVAQDWLKLSGPVEHDFVIAGTHQYVVNVAVPPTAPEGNYTFRLDVLDVDLPDENLTQGPTVTFVVPPPVIEKKGFPIWIPIAIIVAILVIGGGIAAFLATRDGGGQATPTPTSVAVATFTRTPVPIATNTRVIPPTNTPIVIPPLDVVSVQVSVAPAGPTRRICGTVNVTFRGEVTFTGSGTTNYVWSGDVEDSGSLSLNCPSGTCTAQVPAARVEVNVRDNSEEAVGARLEVGDATDNDGALYLCGTVP